MKNETIVETNDARVYEISYILVPTLSEDAAEEKINSIKKSIADLGASFISEEAPYMRDLAYEMLRVIKNANNRFSQGYFGWIKFEIDPLSISKIEKIFKLDEDVIRFLSVKADRNVNIFTKKVMIKEETENVNIDTTGEEAEAVKEEVKEEASN